MSLLFARSTSMIKLADLATRLAARSVSLSGVPGGIRNCTVIRSPSRLGMNASGTRPIAKPAVRMKRATPAQTVKYLQSSTFASRGA